MSTPAAADDPDNYRCEKVLMNLYLKMFNTSTDKLVKQYSAVVNGETMMETIKQMNT